MIDEKLAKLEVKKEVKMTEAIDVEELDLWDNVEKHKFGAYKIDKEGNKVSIDNERYSPEPKLSVVERKSLIDKLREENQRKYGDVRSLRLSSKSKKVDLNTSLGEYLQVQS